jgi:hypothetical protein
MPIASGAALLAGLAAGFLYLLPHLERPPGPADPQDAVANEARTLLEAGHQALAEGRFERAVKEFKLAAQREQETPALSSAERRRLAQLQRQAALLARLLSRSLEEIVREAALVRDEEEWKERFQRDYGGKAVVFDDVVRRDPAGRPVLAHYVVRAADEPVRVALEDLEILRQLPLQTPQRLLFGGQLAAVQREPGGGWVVRFDPVSGVLLTDRAAVSAFYPAEIDDELKGLLQRQAEWLR